MDEDLLVVAADADANRRSRVRLKEEAMIEDCAS